MGKILHCRWCAARIVLTYTLAFVVGIQIGKAGCSVGRPREHYVRVTVESHGYTIEPALEWRPGDNFEAMADGLNAEALLVASAATYGELTETDQMAVAVTLGNMLAMRFPDRHYFVEVWQNGQRGFAQTYQPFDIPRDLEREAIRDLATTTRELLTWLGDKITEQQWCAMHDKLTAIEDRFK